MNTIELPWTFAMAGLLGLGGLAFLMGTVLSSVAELLAVLRGRRNWAGSGARVAGGPVGRSRVRRPQRDPGPLVTTVLAWEDSSASTQRSERELAGPRAAA